MTTAPPQIWYEPQEVLSYNRLYNFVIGVRGCGKSFGWKEFVVGHFLKTGRQFIYLRRTETELDLVLDRFFDDLVSEGKFAGHVMKARKVKDMVEFTIDDKVCGYGGAVSTVYKFKSNTFPYVKYVLFDEFLIEKGVSSYLQNEPLRILGLHETVGRMRDVCFIFIANATSVNNPYFDFWNIRPKNGQRFTTFKHNKQVLIEVYNGEAYMKEKEKTPFYELVKGTPYGEFMFANEWLDDNYDFIEPMKGAHRYSFTIHYEGKSYGVYIQDKNGTYHINKNVDPSCKTSFAFTTDDHKPNLLLFKNAKKNPFIKRLQYAFDVSALRFDGVSTKNAIYKLFDYV